MVVFAVSLFMYMVFLIFLKWTINWNDRMLSATCFDPDGDDWNSDWTRCDQSGNGLCTPWGFSCTDTSTTADRCPLNYGGSGDGCQPPNLITTLINIALQPGTVDEPMYPGQPFIQNILLLCAIGSVPVLLLAKPYFLSQQTHVPIHHHDEDAPLHGDGHDHEEEEHSFGEIVIHQAIETIEFVLGMVSNTASYLRLWALSLAHSELATVFWDKAMLSTLNMDSFIYCYFGFAVFAGVTFGVLLMMDVLECFLHALRLHWVEFQNKFFKADGIRFTPYSFKQIIKESQ
jgi:V-type H+-transporting ATPase subunit a